MQGVTALSPFAFAKGSLFRQRFAMTKPLALVCYENLLPGSQLANRLQDLDYRVQVVPEPPLLLRVAEAEGALVVVWEYDSVKHDVSVLIRQFRQNPATEHIPIVAYTRSKEPKLFAAAQAAGATVVASDVAILNHLPQLLEQALALE